MRVNGLGGALSDEVALDGGFANATCSGCFCGMALGLSMPAAVQRRRMSAGLQRFDVAAGTAGCLDDRLDQVGFLQRAVGSAWTLSMKKGWVLTARSGQGPRVSRGVGVGLISLSRPCGTTRLDGRLASGGASQAAPSCGQSRRGACWSEVLVAGVHVPDGSASARCRYGRPGTPASTPPWSCSGSATNRSTLQIYLHADLALKERALARTPARHDARPLPTADQLLAFLEAF